MRSAVVLYGGKSARMGADKGMLEFRGKPLFSWVYASISRVVDEVVISVSQEEQVERSDFVRMGVIMALDERPGLGPIGGLLSGMKKAQGEYVAVAPVDAPLIMPQLYELLFKKVKGHDGAVPKVHGHWEPLLAVYRRTTMISAINKAIEEETLDIRSTFSYLDIAEVGQHEIETFDHQFVSFANINTFEDLERLDLSK